jgi:hypothetical protein
MSKEAMALVESLKDFDPRKLTEEVIVTGEAWADQDAAATALEETKKTVLAKLVLECMSSGYTSGALGEKPKAIPLSHAELRALTDPRYEQHLDLMVHARKEAHRCRVRYDMGKMRLELMRSLQATLRSEMRISGQSF